VPNAATAGACGPGRRHSRIDRRSRCRTRIASLAAHAGAKDPARQFSTSRSRRRPFVGDAVEGAAHVRLSRPIGCRIAARSPGVGAHRVVVRTTALTPRAIRASHWRGWCLPSRCEGFVEPDIAHTRCHQITEPLVREFVRPPRSTYACPKRRRLAIGRREDEPLSEGDEPRFSMAPRQDGTSRQSSFS